MKPMMVLSAALIVIGAHMIWKEHRRRFGQREQKIRLQNWEGEGGRVAETDAELDVPA